MSDIYLINFKGLQDVVNISVDHRPINIYNLMKHGFKHYIKVSDTTLLLQSQSINLEAKETGKISQTRPSKDYLYYLAYNEEELLTLYNAENDTPIEAYKLLSLLDVAFYKYDQTKEDLLTFVKKQISGNIETSFKLLSEAVSISKEESQKALKPHLKRLNTLLEEANEETIDTFIIFSNSFILQDIFYFRAVIQEKPLSLKEYLEYFLNNIETQLKAEMLLQATLRNQLAEFLKGLNLSEEELIKEFSNPAQELIKKLYSNIASEKDSGQAELERLTALENAKKLEGKDYFIFNYFKYNSIIIENNIKDSNIAEARGLLKDLESGKLTNIINLYNAIFNPVQEAEIVALKSDYTLQATDNIINGLFKMRTNAQKVISSTDLELYIRKDQLSEQEQEELSTRLRRANKEDISDIIAYKNIKIEYDLKKIELNKAKKELKEKQEAGTFGEDLSYLAEKVETLKEELKTKGESIKPLSKNLIFYNGDYYKNKATLYTDTFINEEKSGKVEITNADKSVSLLKDTETAIKENDLTYNILFLIIQKISQTGSNEVFFSLEEIYKFMENKGDLQPNASKSNKRDAVEKFYYNCNLLRGVSLEYSNFKQRGKIERKSGAGNLLAQVNYSQYKGVFVVYNNYLFNNVLKANKGFLLIPKKTDTLTPQTTNLIIAYRLNTNLNPLAKDIKAGTLAQYLGLGDTNYRGKNKSRPIEPFNNILLNAENERAIRIISELPRSFNDKIIIKELLESEEYKRAKANKIKEKTKKKR